MKYFLDTEFYEDGETIDLISIGIVAQDGREYYAVNVEFDRARLYTCSHFQKSAWVRDNVLGQIDFAVGKPKRQIREEIEAFVSPPTGPDEYPEFTNAYWYPIEFWGYYSATDWVAFYQLWGRLIDLPKRFPWWCRDIKQLQADLGNPELPFDPKAHHALEDAKWQKKAYDDLARYAKEIGRRSTQELALRILGAIE